MTGVLRAAFPARERGIEEGGSDDGDDGADEGEPGPPDADRVAAIINALGTGRTHTPWQEASVSHARSAPVALLTAPTMTQPSHIPSRRVSGCVVCGSGGGVRVVARV
jgi:hypothetical protein